MPVRLEGYTYWCAGYKEVATSIYYLKKNGSKVRLDFVIPADVWEEIEEEWLRGDQEILLVNIMKDAWGKEGMSRLV